MIRTESTESSLSSNMSLPYQAVVMGTSAGGTAALLQLLPALPTDYPLPVIIVQHLHPNQGSYLADHYNRECSLPVKEADDKDLIEGGHIYIAPANYHLLIEDNNMFSLSIDEKVNFSRPAIDVLFDSAVDAYGAGVIGVVLTGANHDGAKGLQRIKACGGLTIVQDPDEARVPTMPQAAIRATAVDYILPLNDIAQLLIETAHHPPKGSQP